jgi:hypothetical protein
MSFVCVATLMGAKRPKLLKIRKARVLKTTE